ncbi:MAG: hypothetical protein A2156_03740 [Deltaproteobacteria bacterium RBG_16_48_10]|nr:MAG: hypothetical protein A2156_03740 [Deltaproteobacteria bacterium RBG_16_48_10]
MKIRIRDKTGAWNLKLSGFISMGIHLLFFLTVSVLFFSDAEVRQTPIRFIKVTLYPLGNEKKSIPESFLPLTLKHPIQKPEKREPIREQKQMEPVLKNEITPPIPLPVQAVVRNIPAEEVKFVSPHDEEEKNPKEPTNLTGVAALSTDLNLKKEEDRSAPLPSSIPEVIQGDELSNVTSGEGMGTGQAGSGGGDPGDGSGTGKGGFRWRGSGEGTGFGQGGSSGGGPGNGPGPGPGTGFEQGDSRGGGSRKGIGIFAKLFSSSGGEGGHPRYAENPKPPYPQEARERGYQGEVLLRVEVLSNGRVGQIEIKRSSGYEILDQSALATVKQWKFIPAKKGEDTVSLWVNIPIKFQLR